MKIVEVPCEIMFVIKVLGRMTQGTHFRFLYVTVSTLKPMVGMVETTSPRRILYRMVVLPAASGDEETDTCNSPVCAECCADTLHQGLPKGCLIWRKWSERNRSVLEQLFQVCACLGTPKLLQYEWPRENSDTWTVAQAGGAAGPQVFTARGVPEASILPAGWFLTEGTHQSDFFWTSN